MNNGDRRNTLLIGAALGAVTGLVAAFLLVRRAEEDENASAMTSGEGFRLGMLVIGMLRQIAQLGD